MQREHVRGEEVGEEVGGSGAVSSVQHDPTTCPTLERVRVFHAGCVGWEVRVYVAAGSGEFELLVSGQSNACNGQMCRVVISNWLSLL